MGMRPLNRKASFYYQADSSALGGFFEHPFQKIIPSQASVALPAVGGFATVRTEAFNFEGVISCAFAETTVAGRRVEAGTQNEKDDSFSVSITAVIEGLNILDTITADRIVAKVSIDTPLNGTAPRISLVGSQFEGIRVGGYEASPTLNSDLVNAGRDAAGRPTVTYSNFEETGGQQAEELRKCIPAGEEGAWRWALEKYQWMTKEKPAARSGFVLCSLVDGIQGGVAGSSIGHILEIPGYGRVFLGEIIASRDYVQLAMVRAELGCHYQGGVSAATTTAGGRTIPPTQQPT
jgi:hypothetical protein